MDYLEKFEKFCKSEVSLRLLPLEALRQRMLKKHKIINTIALFLFLFIPFVLFIVFTFVPVFFPNFYSLFSVTYSDTFVISYSIAIFTFPIIGIILWVYVRNYENRFKRIIKENFLPVIMPMFDGLSYSKGKKIISEEEFIAIGFYGCLGNMLYNCRTAEDEFAGEYKGYRFKVSEDIFRTGGKHPSIYRHLNMLIENIDGVKDVFLKETIQKETEKNKHMKLILNVFAYLALALAVILPSVVESEYIIFVSACMFIIFVLLVNWQCNFYTKFDKTETNANNECKNEINLHDLQRICSKINYHGKPQLFIDNNTILISLRFPKNSNIDLFEFGDINTPITDVSSCVNFCMHLALVYKVIDYIKQVKKEASF